MNSIEYGRFEFQRLAFFMIHAVELLHSFEEFLQKADYEDKEIVITGDFNCNFLSAHRI